jgi:hypothetical protein
MKGRGRGTYLITYPITVNSPNKNLGHIGSGVMASKRSKRELILPKLPVLRLLLGGINVMPSD